MSGDARRLPFPDRVFDVVLSSLTLHNIGAVAERVPAVREVAEVLLRRPDGATAVAAGAARLPYPSTLSTWSQCSRRCGERSSKVWA